MRIPCFRASAFLLASAALTAMALARGAGPASAPAAAVPSWENLQKLSDADLLTLYERSALAAGATNADIDLSTGSPSDRDEATIRVKLEIQRRGVAIGPALMEMFLKERAKPAARLSNDEFKLIIAIADPRAAKPLLELAAPNIAMRDWQNDALSGVETITHVSFWRRIVEWRGGIESVPHEKAVVPHVQGRLSDEERMQVLALHEEWLAGEGKDPAKWLALAQKRARELLKKPEDDLNGALSAAAFLSKKVPALEWRGTELFRGAATLPYDDDPDQTVKSLGEILRGTKPETLGIRVQYRFREKLIDVDAWKGFLLAYGPRARAFSPTLIRLHDEYRPLWWGYQDGMGDVGGTQIMAVLAEGLPRIEQAIKDLPDVPPAPRNTRGTDEQRARASALLAQSELRWEFDRWAGHTFDSDEDRLIWWKANRDVKPDQWLRDAMLEAARRADASGPKVPAARPGVSSYDELNTGPQKDVTLFRTLFPDAPFGTDESTGYGYFGFVQGKTPLPYREAWVKAHLGELVYDEGSGTFRMRK